MTRPNNRWKRRSNICWRAGHAVYVATFGDAQLYAALADWLLKLAAVSGGVTAPAGVEMCVRWQGNQRILFVLNHTAAMQQVALPGPCIDLCTAQAIASSTVDLQPHQVVVLAMEG